MMCNSGFSALASAAVDDVSLFARLEIFSEQNVFPGIKKKKSNWDCFFFFHLLVNAWLPSSVIDYR